MQNIILLREVYKKYTESNIITSESNTHITCEKSNLRYIILLSLKKVANEY